MAAFRSEVDVRVWLDETGRSFGALITPQVLYDLGCDWYATRMDFDWQPATAAETTVMFAAHGLTGEFWSL
jgi:hypothetical protein